jgi:hypothetical protein
VAFGNLEQVQTYYLLRRLPEKSDKFAVTVRAATAADMSNALAEYQAMAPTQSRFEKGYDFAAMITALTASVDSSKHMTADAVNFVWSFLLDGLIPTYLNTGAVQANLKSLGKICSLAKAHHPTGSGFHALQEVPGINCL